MKEYLTESKLGNFLDIYYKDYVWIHDKSFISKKRPDYRCDELKLIIEFDGYAHYTSASNIISDIEKDILYKDAGYKVIRIPYFVQLNNSDIIKEVFNIDASVGFNEYQHGFIDEKCILPCDFCSLGIKKFLNDLIRFNSVSNQIIDSLKTKVAIKKDPLLVIPDLKEFHDMIGTN